VRAAGFEVEVVGVAWVAAPRKEEAMCEQWKKGLLAAGWNLRKAIELAVHIEEVGTELYRELARKRESDASLRHLFETLAKDEVAHRKGFQALLASVGTARKDGMDEECLKAIAHACFFSEHSGALNRIENLTSREEILDKVSKFERGTLLYFRGLNDVLGPCPALDTMIAEEKRHTVAVMHAITELQAENRLATSSFSTGTAPSGIVEVGRSRSPSRRRR